MNKEIISDRQGISIIVLFIIGSSSVFTMGLEAKQDLWIAIILALFASTPFVILSARLHILFPNKDLFDIVEICFGKFIGKIIILLFISYTFYWSSDVLTNYGEFIHTVSFPNTPRIIPMACIVVLSAYAVKDGIEVLGRWSEFFLKIPIIILIFVTIVLIPHMDINNIKPIYAGGNIPILKATFALVSFPLGQLPASFTIAFSSFKREYSPYKIYIVGLCIGSLILFITSMNDILVLGVNRATNLYYPTYAVASLINIKEFVHRIEIISAITFILGGFVKISILILCTCKGISKIFNCLDYRFMVIPISLLLINLSYFQYESILHYFEFTVDVWPYYVFTYQTILPTIIFIFAEIKKKSMSKGEENYE